MSAILLLASLQAFFLVTLLFSKRNKQTADKILSMWLGLIGLHAFIYFAYIELRMQNVIVININAGFPFLQGPFLYFYVDVLTSARARLRPTYALHGLPYLFFVGYQLFYLNSFGASEPGRQVVVHIFSLPAIFNLSLLASVPFYIMWSLWLLRRYRLRLLNSFSTLDRINLNWLRYLITALGLVWLMVMAVFVYMRTSGVSQASGITHLIFVAVTLFVYATAYFGFKQSTVFSDIADEPAHFDSPPDATEVVSESKTEIIPAAKYQKSGLKPEEAQKMFDSLLNFMESARPYLDDQLTLSHLAADLNISVNNLSQIINEYCRQNFFDFVNGYRVEAVKSKLQKPDYDAYSLLALAYECGFGSKSSFNRIFKNSTGQTPTQYKKNLQKA
jgi:AraC-like DNA-binding protein